MKLRKHKFSITITTEVEAEDIKAAYSISQEIVDDLNELASHKLELAGVEQVHYDA